MSANASPRLANHAALAGVARDATKARCPGFGGSRQPAARLATGSAHCPCSGLGRAGTSVSAASRVRRLAGSPPTPRARGVLAHGLPRLVAVPQIPRKVYPHVTLHAPTPLIGALPAHPPGKAPRGRSPTARVRRAAQLCAGRSAHERTVATHSQTLRRAPVARSGARPSLPTAAALEWSFLRASAPRKPTVSPRRPPSPPEQCRGHGPLPVLVALCAHCRGPAHLGVFPAKPAMGLAGLHQVLSRTTTESSTPRGLGLPLMARDCHCRAAPRYWALQSCRRPHRVSISAISTFHLRAGAQHCRGHIFCSDSSS